MRKTATSSCSDLGSDVSQDTPVHGNPGAFLQGEEAPREKGRVLGQTACLLTRRLWGAA